MLHRIEKHHPALGDTLNYLNGEDRKKGYNCGQVSSQNGNKPSKSRFCHRHFDSDGGSYVLQDIEAVPTSTVPNPPSQSITQMRQQTFPPASPEPSKQRESQQEVVPNQTDGPLTLKARTTSPSAAPATPPSPTHASP
ncbi:hypothetical protein DPSP01_013730 [Paraphaeosphaeria sporulosa]